MSSVSLGGPWKTVIDTLLPGHGRWPRASALRLTESLAEAVSEDPSLADALKEIERRLSAGFESADLDKRVSDLRNVEANCPSAFALLVERAYGMYYLHPRVTRLLEAQVGYPDRPPQPEGHSLEPFNRVAIEITAAREPFYRKTANDDRSTGSSDRYQKDE